MSSARKTAQPRRIHRDPDLATFQRLMFEAVTRPRAKASPDFATRFLKPGPRLTSLARLGIYQQAYRQRLLRCLQDSCPALHALLGTRKFATLAHAYLDRFPSRSFTPRNFPRQLASFIRQRPRLTAPHAGLAYAVAQFEWAQATAFDGAAQPALPWREVRRLVANDRSAALQPHVSLLALNWPADDFVAAVKNGHGERDIVSSVMLASLGPRAKRVVPPRRHRVRLVLHRHAVRTYCKRIGAAEFAALAAIASGIPLARALADAAPRVEASQLRTWLQNWVQLGWLCRRRVTTRA